LWQTYFLNARSSGNCSNFSFKYYRFYDHYYEDEKMAILNYISSRNYYTQVHKIAIWKEAEEMKVGFVTCISVISVLGLDRTHDSV
jgi:hypothetical protein